MEIISQRPIFTPLNGDIDASKYGSPCVQPTVDGSGIVGQEDCLFLNVYTPQVRDISPKFEIIAR